MNVSELRYPITVQQAVVVKDKFGAETASFSDYMNLKAGVKYVGGVKTVNEKEIFNSNNIIFTTHYRAITDDMQIVFNNKNYKINYIAEIGYKEGLSITAEKINE